MSAHAYTKDQLVEQPAVQLFAALGWQTATAVEEVFGATGTLGRETPSEVVLLPRVRAAFDENLTHYKAEIPPLYVFNALLIASNGTDSRVGSRTEDWERFFEWKRIAHEDAPRRVSLEVMIRGTCDSLKIQGSAMSIQRRAPIITSAMNI